jgi:hypothetical protein
MIIVSLLHATIHPFHATLQPFNTGRVNVAFLPSTSTMQGQRPISTSRYALSRPRAQRSYSCRKHE